MGVPPLALQSASSLLHSFGRLHFFLSFGKQQTFPCFLQSGVEIEPLPLTLQSELVLHSFGRAHFVCDLGGFGGSAGLNQKTSVLVTPGIIWTVEPLPSLEAIDSVENPEGGIAVTP